MKRRWMFGTALLLATLAGAQEFPYELESQRKPTIETHGDVLIRGGRILPVAGPVLEQGDILVRGGKIAAIGPHLAAPAGVQVIDARGKVVTPGLVDAHAHRGSDGTNEGTDSITAEVRIGDVINPFAKNVWQAVASGETTGMVLHGSANAIGGQSMVMKFKYGRPPQELPVPDAPRMIKFALGENVTRMSSADSTRYPRTRMGVESVYRRAFEEARKYMAEWDAYGRTLEGPRPRKDLRLETLADILRKRIWVQCHSYRADEMLMMVRLSQEYGFKLNLQHALEAYKIAPELAKAGVGASVFADSWAYKLEAYDNIPYNTAICTRAGVLMSINTDSLGGTVALNVDAAKPMRFGGMTEQQCLEFITINPAKQIGVDKRTGTLEVGKDADIAIWDGHPLSVYSRCAMTLIEGEVYFQRRDAFGVDKASTTKNVLDSHPRRAPQTLPASAAYAVIGATLHPVSGPVIEGGTIVFVNGTITAIGKDVAVPSSAARIDGTGLHVYPGFIDGSNTMGLSEIGGIDVMGSPSEAGSYQPDLKALTGVQVQSAHFETARFNGITNVMTHPSGGVVSGRGAVIHTFGWTAESMGLQNPGPLWVNLPGGGGFGRPAEADCADAGFNDLISGGWSDGHLLHAHDLETGGLLQRRRGGGGGAPTDAQMRPINEFFDKAAAYAKARADGKDVPVDLQLDAMIPYVRGERPVVMRVRSAAQIRAAVAFAKQHGLKPILLGAQDAWKETKLLSSSNVPVLIEPAGKSSGFANAPTADWEPYDTPYALPALLKRGGVKFAFMSEDNADAMNLPFRVAQSCAYGLSVEDAVRALTLSTAEILGVDKQIGSLQTGKLANLIVTDGDPFELTTTVHHVFVKGRPAPMESRFTRFRDQYMKRLASSERVFGGG
ncbi:MAG: amidohydrolase family protein [Fimbriimonadaceae bacterium]|nr:amidohydrolase family protein [Fimbriimonadaceae bacterium]